MRRTFRFLAATLLLFADTTPQTLPFSQNWTTTSLITANDIWSGVAGIEGFLGQDLTTATGTDPRTILTGASSVANDLDVLANQTNPNITNGGVAEFDGIANPSIALQGSGTADAPHIIITLNTTGQSNINVSYDLRDIDASADNAVQPVALQYRVGTTGNFTDIPSAFVADATTGPSAATLVTPVSATLPAAANDQPAVQVRIITSNAVGNDEWVAVDNISISSGSGVPALSIGDVSLTEGNSGTTTANFTVSLTQPAPAGGVTFNIFTADGTATAASADYAPSSLTGQTIPQGSQTYIFSVNVGGDTAIEPNETFFVNVTSVAGANVSDGQAIGTILNDDVALISISTVQGPGASSPIIGSVVSVRGIVTGVRSNGFYIQTPDADADADPLTSEGLFIFTSSAPPAAAATGNLVQVTGTVAEFAPVGSPNPVTELTAPVTLLVSTGNPLPAPVPFTTLFPSPSGLDSQLERTEGMRVSIPSFTVTQPTDGSVSEANATATSNGIFYGVVTGNPLPFREPGIAVTSPVPGCAAGSACAIPVWDRNPEVIAVDSDRLTGAPRLDVAAKSVITGLTGVLDTNGPGYILFPDPASAPLVSGAPAPAAVPAPTSGEITVAAANLERFFDTADDPGVGDPILTATAFNNRLSKLSRYVREFMRSPDVIAFSEVENLSTLQSAATRINDDTVTAGGTNPQYTPYLVEGLDIGGIDVGFLVKSTAASVIDVVQEGAALTFINPDDGLPDPTYDRPPLRLRASAMRGGQTVNFTVYANHLRSLLGVDTEARTRAKRKAQADSLAAMVQARQIANPGELIAVVGDMNAYEFNDGYVDVIGAIAGTPAPATQVQLSSSAAVNPTLRNMLEILPAAERYSYRFEGSAQVLDHALLSQPLFNRLTRAGYVRVNADFPELERNNSSAATRLSDHDAAWVAFTAANQVSSPVSITSGVTVYNRVTNLFSFVLTVRNTGSNAIAGPLQLALRGLPNGVTITNAAGSNQLGHYFSIPSGLAPNATANVTVSVSNPARAPIVYTTSLWSGIF